MKTIVSVLTSCCIVLFMTACGGGNGSSSTEESSGESNIFSEARKSIDKAEKAAQDMQKGSGEVVDFRDLKDWLPEKVNSLERQSAGGESTGALGFKFSKAEAEYEGDDQRVNVEVIDFGGIQMAITSMAAWSTYERDAETKDGFERTTTINGMKAYVKYRYANKQGEINMLSDHYIINFKTYGLDEKEFERVTEDFNWKKLDKLKPKE